MKLLLSQHPTSISFLWPLFYLNNFTEVVVCLSFNFFKDYFSDSFQPHETVNLCEMRYFLLNPLV